MDYALLRDRMVEEQLIGRGIQDQRVLEAFRKVERHKFLPEDLREGAYADHPIPIGEGQTISQPYIVALMSECLRLKGNETVLEIGTGSGYQTAILTELAKEVFSVERIPLLHEMARKTLQELGYKNIHLKVDDGTLGWSEEGPFERIIITAASVRVPLPLTEQLRESGLLVAPLGERYSQVLTVFEKKQGKLESKQITSCVFVPLIGKFGINE